MDGEKEGTFIDHLVALYRVHSLKEMQEDAAKDWAMGQVLPFVLTLAVTLILSSISH